MLGKRHHLRLCLFLLLFSLFYFWLVLRISSRSAMWIDEAWFFWTASRPTLGEVSQAASEGVQIGFPVLALVHELFRLTEPDLQTARFPSMAGYWILCLSLAVFVYRRSGVAFSMAAACLPLLSYGFRYSHEARSYGLMMGFGAVSALAWQLCCDNPKRRLFPLVLAASIGLTVASHLYGILVMFPFIVGEAYSWFVLRSRDVRRLAAVVIGSSFAVVHLFHVQGILVYRGQFFQAPRVVYLLDFYVLWSALPFVILGVFLILVLRVFHGPSLRNLETDGATRRDLVFCLGFCLIPVVGYLLGVFTGGFVDRYVSLGSVGLFAGSSLFLSVLYRPRPRSVIPLIVLIPILLYVRHFSTDATWVPQPPVKEALQLISIDAVPPGEDIVVSDFSLFLPLYYEAHPHLRKRLMYLFDTARAHEILGFDSPEITYQAMWRLNASGIVPFAEFAHPGKQFFVLAGGGTNWLVPYLRRKGSLPEVASGRSGVTLFRVALDNSPL